MSEGHNAARRIGERTESSRYELIAKLASGGMGSVYVARARGALGFENLVAVKRPHAHLLEARFKAMLVEEARIASRIRHANVVAVRDVAVEGSLVYLVMDYIEGASVAELAGETPETRGELLPVPVVIRICLDAAAGLHAAHEAMDDNGRPLDVVHRDVSPQNVLVGTDGVARLTDFGIAKCFAAPQEHTAEGLVKGKLAYIAPEYARGEPVDRRADVFGLAIVLWELLTGRSLFGGSNNAETLANILLFEPPAPSALRPEVPPGIDAIVLKALAKKPEARQATAEEFGETLEAVARAGGAVALHREVAASLRARVGKMLVRRASAVRAAMVEEGTVDLEEPAARAAEAPRTQPPLASGEVSLVVSSSPETLRQPTSEALAGVESLIDVDRRVVVTPPGANDGPVSVPHGTASTVIADAFATPGPEAPFEPTLCSSGNEAAVIEAAADEAGTLLMPPRASSEPGQHRAVGHVEPHTLPLGGTPVRAPTARLLTTEPMRQSPIHQAQVRVSEPTARPGVKEVASSRGRSSSWAVGLLAVVVCASGALAFARSRDLWPFAAKRGVIADVPTSPPTAGGTRIATATPPSATKEPPVPLSTIASAMTIASAPPSAMPAPAASSSSLAASRPVLGGRVTKSGVRPPATPLGSATKPAATQEPDTSPTTTGTAKLKASPNPYAE